MGRVACSASTGLPVTLESPAHSALGAAAREGVSSSPHGLDRSTSCSPLSCVVLKLALEEEGGLSSLMWQCGQF